MMMHDGSGGQIVGQGVQGGAMATGAPQALAYRMGLARVVLLTLASYGLYLLYWSYVTWKQYRDHAKDDAYPFWHVLSFAVPVYGLFRMHAHARAFKEEMSGELAATVRPALFVGLLAAGNFLYQITEFFLPEQPTSNEALTALGFDVLGMALICGALAHLQKALNRYWDSLPGVRASEARVGIGEVAWVVFGLLMWAGTYLMIVDPQGTLFI